MGIVFEIAAFCWGVIFVFGPQFLRVILEVVSRPVSEEIIYCGCMVYITFTLIVRIVYEATSGNAVCKKANKAMNILKKILSALYILGITCILLLLLKPAMTTVSNFFNKFMEKYSSEFQTLRDIGVFLIVMSSIGFLISFFTRKEKKHSQVEELTEPDEED